jgi:hypothetical protein
LIRALASLFVLVCIAAASARATALAPLASGARQPSSPWHIVGLPRQAMALTEFSLTDLDGRRVLRVEANDAYGNLVHPLRLEGGSPQLAWQWRLDRPLAAADLSSKSGDDNALKVCIFFDLPIGDVPWRERVLLQFARSRSDLPLPSATLCYVWTDGYAVGTAIDNAYTRRVRYLVLRNGASGLRQWASERRDVAADFLLVFGAESRQVPPLTGVALGADTDNTHGHSLGFIADLTLEP